MFDRAAVDLEQPTPIVEVPPQLLDGSQMVGMQDARVRHEDLRVAGLEH